MAHDVFICHARKDKEIALAICEILEPAQVRCWFAERDISGGEDWAEATRNAIASSRVVVLVLSENANAAPHIEREIAHAFYNKRAILPVRLSDTPPKRDFLFYLGNVRWFDAFNLPPERHFEELAASISGIVHGRTIIRDVKLPLGTTQARKTLQYSDSWLGGLRASHYGALEILKRITITASILAAIWLLWFVYSQMKSGGFLPEEAGQTVNAGHGAALTSTPKGTPDSSASKPTSTYTRFGLWVSPNAGPAPSREERASYQAEPITVPAPSVSATPTPIPNGDQNTVDGKEGAGVHDDSSGNSVSQPSPDREDRTAPLAVEPSPTPLDKPAPKDPEPASLAETNQGQAAVPLSTPSVAPLVEPTPPEAQSSESSKVSSEEKSLKELVLDYLSTVATDDPSSQERLFAGRVNFYDKGVLSFAEMEVSMERYRREWPIRKWEPKGEPEFPNSLHSSNPDLYEVLQPFDWTVANGSKHKQGSAALYVRIRKAENGAFYIFHLEQRRL